MIGNFYEYVKTVILFLIFTSFMQVILPNSKYKNYINLVFSMILIFIMIRPIHNIYESVSTLNIGEIIEDNNVSLEKEDYKEYENIKNELAGKIFNDNVKMKMKSIIPGRFSVSDIDLGIMKNDGGEVLISSIQMELLDTENSVYVRKYDEEETKRYEKEIKKIKEIVSDYYSINIEKIYINII